MPRSRMSWRTHGIEAHHVDRIHAMTQQGAWCGPAGKYADVRIDDIVMLLQPYVVDLCGSWTQTVTQADIDQHEEWRQEDLLEAKAKPDYEFAYPEAWARMQQIGMCCTDCARVLAVGDLYWGELYEPNCIACETVFKLENLLDSISQLPGERLSQGTNNNPLGDEPTFMSFTQALCCAGRIDMAAQNTPHVLDEPPAEPEPTFVATVYESKTLHITEEELSRMGSSLVADHKAHFEKRDIYRITDESWKALNELKDQHRAYKDWEEELAAEMGVEPTVQSAAAARFLLDWFRAAGIHRNELPTTFEFLESRRSFLERIADAARED